MIEHSVSSCRRAGEIDRRGTGRQAGRQAGRGQVEVAARVLLGHYAQCAFFAPACMPLPPPPLSLLAPLQLQGAEGPSASPGWVGPLVHAVCCAPGMCCQS